MSSQASLPTVAVISLGGTISCTPNPELAGVAPSLGADDLLGVYGLETAPANISPITWSTRDSSEITFNELIRLASRIRELYAEGLDGVVVTQGTDTIDETAFVLDLLLGNQMPVVVTGAMRDPSRPGADGAANLWSALAIAPTAELRTLGTVVTMDNQIHLARWVQKTHTSRLSAFKSPGLGPVAWLSEQQIFWVLRPFESSREPINARQGEATVALVPIVLDGSTEFLEELPKLGFQGLVLSGMGGGHTDGGTARIIGELTEKIPVVYTSRTGSGNVLRRTYDSPGAEIDLQKRGAIPGGTLTATKARILLTLLLRAGASTDEIRHHFAEFG